MSLYINPRKTNEVIIKASCSYLLAEELKGKYVDLRDVNYYFCSDSVQDVVQGVLNYKKSSTVYEFKTGERVFVKLIVNNVESLVPCVVVCKADVTVGLDFSDVFKIKEAVAKASLDNLYTVLYADGMYSPAVPAAIMMPMVTKRIIDACRQV